MAGLNDWDSNVQGGGDGAQGWREKETGAKELAVLSKASNGQCLLFSR